MMTMKQAFARAQGNETDYNAYDEYIDEMRKKYDCERARVMKQKEFQKESTWKNIERRAGR